MHNFANIFRTNSPVDFILFCFMYLYICLCFLCIAGQVGLGVGSWPSNRATEGSNPRGTQLYFVILLKNV